MRNKEKENLATFSRMFPTKNTQWEVTRHLQTNEVSREKVFVIFIPKYSSFVSGKWKISRAPLELCPSHYPGIVPHWISPIKQWSEPLWGAAFPGCHDAEPGDLAGDRTQSLHGEIRNICVKWPREWNKAMFAVSSLQTVCQLGPGDWRILFCNFTTARPSTVPQLRSKIKIFSRSGDSFHEKSKLGMYISASFVM